VDVHGHTPASADYGRGPNQAQLRQRSPRDSLLDFMRAEIDCVVVADHNSGDWVDRLRDNLSLLDEQKPEGYRPLWLFPGTEISVNGGVHVITVLPPDRRTRDIEEVDITYLIGST
jgi:hypothetical protein